jgi:sulfur relay (sulfurtransferase) DsrF/TusC family protein
MKRYLTIFTLGPEYFQTLQESLDALLIAAGFYDVCHALFIHDGQWLISELSNHASPEFIKLHRQFRALPLYDIAIYSTQPNPAITVQETLLLSPETTLNFIKQHDCIWTS